MELVEYLLQQGANANSSNNKGRAPLHLAILGKYYEIVKVLIQEDSLEIDSRDVQGVTPLSLAAMSGQKDVAVLLLGRGSNPDEADILGNSSLHHAAKNNGDKSKEMVFLLIQNNANIDNQNSFGCTPLFRAVTAGNLEVVSALLDSGADADLSNCKGKTPLHKAIEVKKKEIALLLAKTQEDLDVADFSGSTALHGCVMYEMGDVLKILLQRGADPRIRKGKEGTPMNMAAVRERVDLMEKILKASAPNFYSSVASLHLGAEATRTAILAYWGNERARQRFKHVEATYECNPYFAHCMAHDAREARNLETFLELGGDANFMDETGVSLLGLAARTSVRAVKSLILHGADLNRGISTCSPLSLAACAARLDIVRLLLKFGADPNLSIGGGCDAPLFVTIVGILRNSGVKAYSSFKSPHQTGRKVSNYWKVLKALLKAGADPNLKLVLGEEKTLLLEVCLKATDEWKHRLVRALLQAGADPNERSHFNGVRNVPPLFALVCVSSGAGRSAFSLQRAAEVARELLRHGANVFHSTETNVTALDIALEQGNEEVALALSLYIDNLPIPHWFDGMMVAQKAGDFLFKRMTRRQETKERGKEVGKRTDTTKEINAAAFFEDADYD